ncbi:MAG: UDP-N-acetyl-d-glucosamine 6-dehydrogenase WbpA [Lysobacterales bacterium]|jgi:UDP-N-acetyl-D-galactosamine dehydrogenase|nr:MAG: UDP-N-acetyl-d-glucosamine 6-dehydrogenase WbpA [Xanthomonadales bacterium]
MEKEAVAVIGLGYVGLPLALAFGRQRPTLGFDLDATRIAELRRGIDRSGECAPEALAEAKQLRLSSDPEALRGHSLFVIAVPTPVDRAKRPDLTALLRASETVGRALTPDSLVIYESTVYPGCTEEVCVPVLEQLSGLRYEGCAGQGPSFAVGYSPERINPGDPEHRLDNVVKLIAASSGAALSRMEALYGEVVRAGLHRCSSIRVAEAAKVIENTQRDLNIALVNELAILFHKLGLDTLEVLEAAGTKWNFLPFRPGLVGGHCIGVDPYYLTYKAQEIGHHPQLILAGRRINDGMGAYVAERVLRLMLARGIHPVGARALILGLAFKENVRDIRNSRIPDMVEALRGYRIEVAVHDPLADPEEARREYGLELLAEPPEGAFDAVVLAVAHRQYRECPPERIRAFGKPGAVLFDVKGVLPREAVDGRL